MIVFPWLKLNITFFKNTFFPSVIIDWIEVDPSIQNAESVGISRAISSNLLDPHPKSFLIVTIKKELD